MRNRPVTTGDRVATDGGARAEVQVGSSTLRLDGSTELEVLQLDDDTMRYQLHGGSVAARLRTREAAREFELHTAEGRFRPQSAGHFRFDRIDETSHVTAWRGQLLFEGDDTAVTVMSGQRAEVWKDPRTQYTLTTPGARRVLRLGGRARPSRRAQRVDPLCLARDDRRRRPRPPWPLGTESRVRRAVDSVRGVAGLGPVSLRPLGLHPAVGLDLGRRCALGLRAVPLRPLGAAPRGVVLGAGHATSRGRSTRRRSSAWVGGPRASFSIGIGSGPSVGWFPLGPREVYVPGYAVSPRYAHNVNVTHIGNNPDGAVQRTPYVNRGPHGVTVVPSTVVMNRQPVGPAMALTTDPNVARQITGAPVQAQPPVAAPTEPPRIDVRRGVPRERTHGPMVGGPNAAHAPDHAFGRTRVPGSSVPLAAPVAPVTPPPAVTLTPPAATPTPRRCCGGRATRCSGVAR